MKINKEKIDLVYCWVNGNDKEWYNKKQQYALKENQYKIINSKCRYRDNEELKYSLRSVEKYAPWINNIYIVTDNQIPEWLNLENSKIHIINHKEIIPEKYLPVFNSNVILHHIPNIKNLSEFYLYSDDDMFFCSPTKKSFFFSNDGFPYIRYGSFFKENPNDTYISMISNASKLIEAKYNKKINLTPHHNIDSYRKSDVLNCKKIFSEKLKDTFSRRFRSAEDIERILYMYYATIVHHAHIKGAHAITIHIPFLRNTISSYINNFYKKESLCFINDNIFWSYDFSKTEAKLFCINDVEETTENNINKSKEVLNKLFPNKSTFEK